MRAMLLGLAAPLAALALPLAQAQAQAQAQAFADPGFTAAPGAAVPGHLDRRDRDGRRHDRHRHRGRDNAIVFGGPWGAPEAWALYNNRSWAPDSFNDWWHDRPDRAYPRWMQSNQACDRMWWGGGAWRCSW